MLKTSASFNRGFLAGALLIGGLASVGWFFIPANCTIPSLRIVALANVIVALGLALVPYSRELRLCKSRSPNGARS